MSASTDRLPSPDAPPAQRVRRARFTLLLVFAVCAAPIVLGTLAFYFWPPSGRTNYGELIAPTQLRWSGTHLDGKPFDPRSVAGKWVLVVIDGDACDARCEQKLYFSRQVRTAQGRESERVTRLWITDAAPSEKIAPLLAGAQVLRVQDKALLSAFGPQPANHVYLVDDMGNLMMRFPEDADPKRMIKDLQKLLRVNNRGN